MKIPQPDTIIVQNLRNIINELQDKYDTLTIPEKTLLFKLNSCIFRDEDGNAQYSNVLEQQQLFDQAIADGKAKPFTFNDSQYT